MIFYGEKMYMRQLLTDFDLSSTSSMGKDQS